MDWLGQAGPATLEIFEPMSDSIGCAHCFGSGYIVRRRALDDIGGWPKVPVGEDIFCSYMLAGYGWGIAFVKEIVQYSLTADSFDILLAQRRRWVSIILPVLARRPLTGKTRSTATCFWLKASIFSCLLWTPGHAEQCLRDRSQFSR